MKKSKGPSLKFVVFVLYFLMDFAHYIYTLKLDNIHIVGYSNLSFDMFTVIMLIISFLLFLRKPTEDLSIDRKSE